MLMMFFFYILLILLKTWSKFNLIWISWTIGLSLIILSLTHLSLNTFSFFFKTQPFFDTFCTPHISNTPLERVLSYNYLGVTISYNLSWSSHVHNLCKKACKLIGFLYRNFYKGSSSSTLLNIYTSHIRPILNTALQFGIFLHHSLLCLSQFNTLLLKWFQRTLFLFNPFVLNSFSIKSSLFSFQILLSKLLSTCM